MEYPEKLTSLNEALKHAEPVFEQAQWIELFALLAKTNEDRSAVNVADWHQAQFDELIELVQNVPNVYAQLKSLTTNTFLTSYHGGEMLFADNFFKPLVTRFDQALKAQSAPPQFMYELGGNMLTTLLYFDQHLGFDFNRIQTLTQEFTLEDYFIHIDPSRKEFHEAMMAVASTVIKKPFDDYSEKTWSFLDKHYRPSDTQDFTDHKRFVQLLNDTVMPRSEAVSLAARYLGYFFNRNDLGLAIDGDPEDNVAPSGDLSELKQLLVEKREVAGAIIKGIFDIVDPAEAERYVYNLDILIKSELQIQPSDTLYKGMSLIDLMLSRIDSDKSQGYYIEELAKWANDLLAYEMQTRARANKIQVNDLDYFKKERENFLISQGRESELKSGFDQYILRTIEKGEIDLTIEELDAYKTENNLEEVAQIDLPKIATMLNRDIAWGKHTITPKGVRERIDPLIPLFKEDIESGYIKDFTLSDLDDYVAHCAPDHTSIQSFIDYVSENKITFTIANREFVDGQENNGDGLRIASLGRRYSNSLQRKEAGWMSKEQKAADIAANNFSEEGLQKAIAMSKAQRDAKEEKEMEAMGLRVKVDKKASKHSIDDDNMGFYL